MKNRERIGLHGSRRGHQRANRVPVRMLNQSLYSNMEQRICRCRVESPRATTMATTKFLYDRHKTNVDTSENLINNAEDVENTVFKV